jgi:hypothetical protein
MLEVRDRLPRTAATNQIQRTTLAAEIAKAREEVRS